MIRILIVDSCPVARAFQRRVIALCGLDAATTDAEPHEAIGALRRSNAELILCNSRDAEDLLRALRNDPALPPARIIAIGSEKPAGLHGFLPQPFDLSAMHDEVERVLAYASDFAVL